MKEKNKVLNIIILAVGVILFLSLSMLMSNVHDGSYQGIITELQVLVAAVLVISVKKMGFFTALILCAYSMFMAFLGFIMGTKIAIVGVLTSGVTICILCAIYLFINRSEKQHKELLKQYEEMIDSNRLMREKDETLQILAYQDEMTGMHNLVWFREQIENSIRQNTEFTMIYMDLDNFKTVNDKFGPEVGDSALKIYADRLKAYCGNKYLCARTSGDDFALLLTGTSTEADILNIIEQLRKILGEPVAPMGVSSIAITASYGIAAHPRDGKDTDMLLDNAIIAVYRAKANGKNMPCFFSQA